MKNFLFIVVCFCSIFSANAQRTIGIAPIDGTGGTIVYPTSCIGNPILSSVITTQTSATLTYTRNGTTSHHIEYCIYGTTAWTPIPIVITTSSSQTQTISGLTCNKRYQFRIRKSCINGGYIYSTIITKYTTVCTASTPILNTPVYANNTSCSGASSSAAAPNRFNVNLSWSAVAGATGYQLQYAKVGTTTSWQPITPTTVTGTTHTLSGLAAGTYQWRVKANNSSVYGTSTPTTNFIIDPIQIDYIASPPCPTGQVCWANYSTNCPERYIVNYEEWVTTSVYTPHIGWEILDEGYVTKSIIVYPPYTSAIVPADACNISVMAIKGANQSNILYSGLPCPSLRQSSKKVASFNSTATFTLYPNPTAGSFTVAHPAEVTQLEVMDMTGRSVWTSSTNGGSTTILDISEYPAGLYLVKANNGMTQKIVKQ